MAKASKKSAKEASNIFHNIMKASVSGNPTPKPKKKEAKTAMTLSEFNQLEKAEQHKVTLKHGEMVEDKREGKNIFILYHIFSFYVEVSYHLDTDELRHIKSFSNNPRQ